jgi:hypothetical protein
MVAFIDDSSFDRSNATQPAVSGSRRNAALFSLPKRNQVAPTTELDLVAMLGGKRVGFEFKHSDTPQITRSMRDAVEDLAIHQNLRRVLHPWPAAHFALVD